MSTSVVGNQQLSPTSPNSNSPSSPCLPSPPSTTRPPLSVIVLHGSFKSVHAEVSASSQVPMPSSVTTGSPGSSTTWSHRGGRSASGGTPPVGPSAFRLQPRGSFTSTPSSRAGARRRKRGANALSTNIGSPPRHTGGASSSTAADQIFSAYSPRTESATLFMQGLSLQSPKRSYETAIGSETSPLSSTASTRSWAPGAFTPPTYSSRQQDSGTGAASSSPASKVAPLKLVSQMDSPSVKSDLPPLRNAFFSSLEEVALETPKRSAEDMVFTSPNGSSPDDEMKPSLTPRTPLPSINLTPRSAVSSNSRRQPLPSFPSPEEFSSPSPRAKIPSLASTPRGSALSSLSGATPKRPKTGENPRPDQSASSEKLKPAVQASKTGSYLPLFDWGQSDQVCGPPNCRSVLGPPGPAENLNHLFSAAGDETGSLSNSDDESEFLLATPGAIALENEARMPENDKFGNKRRAYERRPSRQSASSLASDAFQSNTSLRGMDFIPSHTNLFGMGRQLSSKNLDRIGSQTSIGLSLDQAARDLVTPPAMERPMTPPRMAERLSSRRDDFEDACFYVEDGDSFAPHDSSEPYENWPS